MSNSECSNVALKNSVKNASDAFCLEEGQNDAPKIITDSRKAPAPAQREGQNDAPKIITDSRKGSRISGSSTCVCLLFNNPAVAQS